MVRQRIVTGFDDQGKSVIVSSGSWPGQWDRGEHDYRDDLWLISAVPAPLDVVETTSDGPMRVVPAGNEIAVGIVTLPPTAALEKLTESERAARQQRMDYTDVESIPDDPYMHSTPTLDVVIVVSGEVDLELDSGQVAHLKSGDSVIQRGTMHAWRVKGDAPCVMAGVVVRGTVELPEGAAVG